MLRCLRTLAAAVAVMAGSGAPARAAEVVYSSTFDPLPGWSATGVSPLITGQEWSGNWFLGPFGGDIYDLTWGWGTLDNRTDVTLSLEALPAHTTVTVEFDLFVMGTWDGNMQSEVYGGPDLFQLAVGGGPLLMSTTFALCDPASQSQAYPDEYPAQNPAGAGAVALNVLGVYAPTCGNGLDTAVFHVARTFEHAAPGLALQFSGIGLQVPYDESWGLDNVVVSLDGLTFYASAFDPSPLEGWAATGVSPLTTAQEWSGNWFLGQFAGDIYDLTYGWGSRDNRTDVTLRLADLPTHTRVTASFDLFVIGTWDGNQVYEQYGGPDFFRLEVLGGPTLMNTTVALCDPALQSQAYPDDYPASHTAGSGATALSAIGVYAPSCGNGLDSAIFHIERIFDHDAADLALQFSGVGLQVAYDESWGLDNVAITVDGSTFWSGVLDPINADGTSVFRAGRTVPVKFKLKGPSAGNATLVARLAYARIDGTEGVGVVNEAESTSAATEGSLFRYDAEGGQYVFNWSTQGLQAGRYRLSIDLGDGAPHFVDLGLR